MKIIELNGGGSFEGENISELSQVIVDYFCESEEYFSGVKEIYNDDGDEIRIPEGFNSQIEIEIEEGIREGFENNGSDLRKDYQLNLI